jgi:hypothetical protein
MEHLGLIVGISYENRKKNIGNFPDMFDDTKGM